MLPVRQGNTIGAILVVLLASLIIFIFFNRHVTEANQVSFATGGDGVKSTFGSMYHLDHDTSWWYTMSMNYPFGESVFFTGNQVFETNFLRLLKSAGLDLSGYTLGILNLWMLFSFVLCSLLLYLIFREFKVYPWYAVIASLVITFLSPQLDRFGGHYDLAYAWVFPLAIYLMIRFYRKPSWMISILYGFFVFIIAGKQLYFVVLTGILWVFFAAFMLVERKKARGRLLNLVWHLLVQMVIPFFLFNMLSGMYDANIDRTAYPWGFFQSTCRLESVFLPLGKPYGLWIHIRGSWRNVAYVGLVSTLTFIAVATVFFWRWAKYDLRTAMRVSDLKILNVFFLGAFIALLISLGFPFNLGIQKLLNYMGPLRQFRAIGRFVFPFYYLMNILAFYLLWRMYVRSARKWALVLLLAALAWGCYDAWLNINYVNSRYYIKFPSLNDRENKLEEDQWVLRHDWSEYQAIMPLPYFHIGSENYWLADRSPAIEPAYFASIKTGLPLNAVMLSRTSISQSLMNLDLIYEPYREYTVLPLYKPDKPILLMHVLRGKLSGNERRLIDHSVMVDSNSTTRFYRFIPDSLNTLLEKAGTERFNELEHYNDTMERGFHVFETFQDRPSGQYRANITRMTEFFNCQIPDTGRYMVSFWFEGTLKDLYPRTNYYIRRQDSTGNTYSYNQSDFFREMVLREGNMGLVEFPVEITAVNSRLILTCQNRYLPRGEVVIDNVLVRPAGSKIRVYDGERYGINNRYMVPHRMNSSDEFIR